MLVTLRIDPTSHTAVDVIFLAAYAIQLCGLMSLFRSSTASRHRLGWFDAAAVGVAVLAVVWSTMYDAIFRGHRATLLDWLTRFGGAVLGVALLAMALRLALSRRGRSRALNLLLGGFALQVVTDSAAALWRGYAPGSRLDTLWAVADVLLAAALLEAGRDHTPAQAPTRLAHQEIEHTLVLQAAVTVIIGGMIVIEAGTALPVATLIGWGCSWLVILVLTRIRMSGLLRLVAEASATENQRRLTAMVASSSDVIGLADPDGTIRYITPSIAALTGVRVEAWLGQRFDLMLARHVAGLHDLASRSALLGPGATATWEGTVAPGGTAPLRTLELTLANRIDAPEVNGWVITAHDVTDHARLTSELRHQSLHDGLTGLPNRGLLFDRIQHWIDRTARCDEARMAVVLIDIDDFKTVNDSLGHTTGDELLRAVAGRLVASVRHGDTVARLGGDEFAILLEDTDDLEAMVLAERALESLALPVPIGGGDYAVRASAGVVCRRGDDAIELLRSADIAMYASKRDGKAKVTLFEESMHDLAQARLSLRMDLEAAVDRSELRLVYQPIVDVDTTRIKGVEALVRWDHPRRGLVAPSEFIPIAEQSGQIHAIGSWVLRTACREAASWSDDRSAPYVSVNVAASQLRDETFIDFVLGVLVESRLHPARLMLEITESMLVDDSAHARDALARLRELGVRIAIDDFGTGYSSLAYLRSMCVDVVKIDRSFVTDLDTNPDHQALTRSILALAAGLEMTAIAEGIETDDEYDALARMGCQLAQGYLFSKPLTPATLRTLLATRLGPRSAPAVPAA